MTKTKGKRKKPGIKFRRFEFRHSIDASKLRNELITKDENTKYILSVKMPYKSQDERGTTSIRGDIKIEKYVKRNSPVYNGPVNVFYNEWNMDIENASLDFGKKTTDVIKKALNMKGEIWKDESLEKLYIPVKTVLEKNRDRFYVAEKPE